MFELKGEVVFEPLVSVQYANADSLTRDHMSAPEAFLLTKPALSQGYSRGFNGGETS